MQKSKKKKIAVIVWKWQELKSRTLTREILADYKNEKLAEWIGKYLQTYEVVKKRTGGKKPSMTGNQVVCIRTAKGIAEDSLAFLQDLADHYRTAYPQAEIYYFLHRTDGFSFKTISALYERNAVDKCFLFSDGQDFIYYPSQEMGLLHDGGYFHYEPPSRNQPEVRVANEKNKWVYNAYFYPTWRYYSNEYYTKAIELREDLLDYYLTKIDQLDSEVSLYYLKEILDTDGDLQLRVKSLLNHRSLNGQDLESLRLLERQQQKSYSFDDLKAFVQKDDQLKKTHEELLKAMGTFYYAEPESTSDERIIPRQQLQNWQTHFIQLANGLHHATLNS